MDRRKFIALSVVAVMVLTIAPTVQPAFASTSKLETDYGSGWD